MKRKPSIVHALIALDKPSGMTSHDAVYKVRKAIGERRVGHAGTLDPDATGVLVVGIGQAARLSSRLTLATKQYECLIRLGSQTSTDDAEGEVVARADVPDVYADARQAAAYLATLVGRRMQVPPQYSAVSKNGVRAYQAARNGETVELEARPIEIYESDLLSVVEDGEGIAWRVSFTVSKGTYIRSIARDIGLDLGCYAHVETLRRLASGSISIDDCVTLDSLESEGLALVHSWCLDPVEVLGNPVRFLGDTELEDVRNGKRIPVGSLGSVDGTRMSGRPEEGLSVSLVHDGKLAGIWQVTGPTLKCEVNFSEGIEGVRLHG
jgi:tRNA pseudouridine55 synthase